MSGIAASSGSGATTAPAPLTCSVTFTGGIGPLNVDGTSGNFIDNFSPARIFSYTAEGGTPPYGAVKQILGDPSGKLSIGSAGTLVPRDTLFWAGFSLNETEGCYIQYDVTDDVGATVSARYPETGSIIVKRTT